MSGAGRAVLVLRGKKTNGWDYPRGRPLHGDTVKGRDYGRRTRCPRRSPGAATPPAGLDPGTRSQNATRRSARRCQDASGAPVQHRDLVVEPADRGCRSRELGGGRTLPVHVSGAPAYLETVLPAAPLPTLDPHGGAAGGSFPKRHGRTAAGARSKEQGEASSPGPEPGPVKRVPSRRPVECNRGCTERAYGRAMGPEHRVRALILRGFDRRRPAPWRLAMASEMGQVRTPSALSNRRDGCQSNWTCEPESTTII
jgi:hypothetical protein